MAVKFTESDSLTKILGVRPDTASELSMLYIKQIDFKEMTLKQYLEDIYNFCKGSDNEMIYALFLAGMYWYKTKVMKKKHGR